MHSCGRSAILRPQSADKVGLKSETYPNLATSINSESVTSPDKLSIDIRDHDVLNDNVAPACDAEAFAFAARTVQSKDYIGKNSDSHSTRSTFTQQGFIGADSDS